MIMVLIDHVGQNEEAPGTDAVKFPYGLLDYNLSSHAQLDVTWNMSGNLGNEQYRDHARGPRDEGAPLAERKGYHLPDPPSQHWRKLSPMQGLSKSRVNFYSTSFDLHVPEEYDMPMSLQFNDGTYSGAEYRLPLNKGEMSPERSSSATFKLTACHLCNASDSASKA